MVKFKAVIQKMDAKGGWTYIEVPMELAEKLRPGSRAAFRAKGRLDKFAFKQIAIMPLKNGDFLMPLNKDLRKGIGKSKGHEVMVQMELDKSEVETDKELMECLREEPKALAAFNKLSKAEQNYFSNSIKTAKTEATKAKRIAETINAMLMGQKYGEMVRWLKAHRKERE